MLDLDRFGLVNKLHGHAAGDVLLTSAVGQMRELGDADSLVGRLGGDEFAVTVRAEPEVFARELLTPPGPRRRRRPEHGRLGRDRLGAARRT